MCRPRGGEEERRGRGSSGGQIGGRGSDGGQGKTGCRITPLIFACQRPVEDESTTGTSGGHLSARA